MADLVIRDLHASIDGAEILKGIDLEVSKGEVHAIMGPNGSGKSTLSHVLMGHPAYEVTGGEVTFNGEDVLELEPDERSQLGLFLAFQYPHAIPGVTVANFLRMAVNAHRRDEDGTENPIRIPEFRKLLQESMEQLKIDRSMTSRYLNDGFSGGEKKRIEMLQMAMLQPKIAILDETDSGLDIDALRIVAEGVNSLVGPEMGVARHHALPAPAPLHQAASTCTCWSTAGSSARADPSWRTSSNARATRLWRRRGGGLDGPSAPSSPRGDARQPRSASTSTDSTTTSRRSSRRERGLTEDIVRQISAHKSEPEWMLEFRLKATEHFVDQPMPKWGADLSTIDFESIFYYLKPAEEQAHTWDDVPDDIKKRSTSWASPRPRRSTWPASARSTSPRSSTTASRRTSEARASSSWTPTPALREHEDLVRELLRHRSSRPTTTSSPR